MAREIKLNAVLNFKFVDQAEYTDMRTKAIAFAAANSGTYKIPTLDNPANEDAPYTGKLYLEFDGLTRSGAAGLMTTIDNALGDLPELIKTNGFFLNYDFNEQEV